MIPNQNLQALLKEDSGSSSEKKLMKNPRPVSAKLQDGFHISNLKKQVNIHHNFRPSTSKTGQDPQNLAKSHPKSPSLNRERLYEENISLKMKANTLQEENLKLRTKINQIEKDLNKKEEFTEGMLLRSGSKTHLIPNLKQSIKDLKEQIKNKEEEISKLKKNIKSTKMMEIDVEMQSYVDECTRLKHHLEEIMAQKHISFTSLEFEEKLFRQNMDIHSLRQENSNYSQALNKAREEMVLIKEKINTLENPTKKRKKSTSKKQELLKLKADIGQIKGKIDMDKELFLEKEEQLTKEAENLVKSNDGILLKIQATEVKLQEQNIVLEQLRSQIMNHEKDFKRSQTIDAPAFNFMLNKKLQNPPKLFQMINQIIIKKQMMVDVFFSLMDKNSNGSIDVDEIHKAMLSHGSKVKTKYIQEALTTIGASTNSIPLSTIQENYEKYDYKQNVVLSSSEEEDSEETKVIQKKVTAVEKLKFVDATPNLPEGVIIPQASAPAARVIREDKKMLTVKYEEIKDVVDEITWKMKKAKLPKGKVLSKVFGDDVNPDAGIDIDKLAQILNKSSLELADTQRNHLFARFLIEPEGKSEILESQLKSLKCEILVICKKLMKLFSDWKVHSDLEISEAFDVLKLKLTPFKEKLIEECQKQDISQSGYLDFEAFKFIADSLCEISSDIWDIWGTSLFPSHSLNYKEYLSALRSVVPVDTIIQMVSTKLNQLSASPESLFPVSSQGMINAEDFISGISKLGLDITNDEYLNLLEAVRHKSGSKFTIMVNINELYQFLSSSGFKSQTLTSSDEDESTPGVKLLSNSNKAET